MGKSNRLWVETYRPKVINDIIFKNEMLKQIFNKMIKERNVPNLIFSGVQGSGKSTLSTAIVNELKMNSADVIRINASNDNGVEMVKTRIEGFAQTMPLGDFKIVQLEEFRLSAQAQENIRPMIEDYSDTCRFIITTNYVNRIIPSVKSRFQEYVFSAPDFDQVFAFAFGILEKENIRCESEKDIDLLEKFVTSVYPDIRKVVQLLQQHSFEGKLIYPDGNISNDDYKFKLLEYLEKDDYLSIRKTLIELIPSEEYDDVFSFLYQNIHKCPKFKTDTKEKAAIITISDHLYKHALVAHPHINLAALFINLGEL